MYIYSYHKNLSYFIVLENNTLFIAPTSVRNSSSNSICILNNVTVHVDSEFESSVGLAICCVSYPPNRNYWQLCAASVTRWPNVTARICSRSAVKPTLVKSAASSHWPMCTLLGDLLILWTHELQYIDMCYVCICMCTCFVISRVEGVSGFTTHFAVRQAVMCWRTHHTIRQLIATMAATSSSLSPSPSSRC